MRTLPPLIAQSRRQAERLAIELPLTVRVSVPGKQRKEQTRTVDISRGGASFQSAGLYRPGMGLLLTFPELQGLPGGKQEIPSQVVRVIKPNSGRNKTVAIRFDNVELANLVFSELLRARIRSSSALLGIIQALSPGSAMEEVIEHICRTTERAMEAERALLFLLDQHKNAFLTSCRIGGRLEDIQISKGEGLVGKSAGRDRPTNVQSLTSHRHFLPKVERYFDNTTRSVLCIPLAKEDGITPGILVIQNKRYGHFTREDEVLGVAVAGQIAAVLREARLFASIRDMKYYYERILESIATGILTFDGEGKLTTVNRAATEIFGFRTNAHLGLDFRRLMSGAANARLISLTDDLLSKRLGRKAYDVRYLRGDGSSFSLDLSALPLEDTQANFLGGVLVAEDITQEQRLMNTLCRYMAREVAEQVLQNKDELKLGGTRAEVTILITDIRNFTTISEQLDPWDIVELLNAYFPRMINVIFRHQGMVDKFIGDSILAVFGVPVPREDDSLRAVRAALEMRRELRAINRERARKQQRTIEIGIGVTCGTVISGNIGSERRMDYTVIGDPVNLAARLEGLTKEVKRMILVNQRVHAAIEKEIPCEALGLFAVKGKAEKVPVFAVKTRG